MDLDQYRLPANGAVKLRTRPRSAPRHRSGEWFLKGPIPFNWLSMTSKLPGKSLAVGLAIWFEAGRSKKRSVKVTHAVLSQFGVGRQAGTKSLVRLYRAGLISLQQHPGRSPVATLLDYQGDCDRGPTNGRSGKWFLKGPIPFNWLSMASRLPGRSLAVGMAIWFEAGRSKDRSVKMTHAVLSQFGVGRQAGTKSLVRLYRAGLISLQRHSGRAPVVTLLDGKEL